MMTRNKLRFLLGVGLFVGASLAARADDTVTFQVDLSRYTNSAGQQVANVVDVRGNFSSPLPTWAAGMTLYNNGANVYTNTFTVPGNAGDNIQYKFTYTTAAGITWEDDNPPPEPGQPPDEGNNRVLALVGGAQTLPVTAFYAPSVTPPINLSLDKVTFKVDMSRFTNSAGQQAASLVDVRGAFNSWNAGWTLINNGANVYTNTFDVVGAPAATFQYKFTFTIPSGVTWEDNNPPPGPGQPPDAGNNRVLALIGAGGPQVLPEVPFYAPSVTTPIDPPTNGAVTFRVDMTPQVLTGGFVNGSGVVNVSGGFTGWGTGAPMTNDPSLTTVASNIYSTTLNITNTPNAGYTYKFRANGGWETANIYGVGINKDRQFFLQGGPQVLPLVSYDDASLCDVLLEPTTTTYVLHITNGTTAIDGTVFQNDGSCILVINGEILPGGWQGWNEFLPHLVNNPEGSDFWEYTQVATGSRARKFKFGIYGPNPSSPTGFTQNMDNESPQYEDHVQYIRTLGSTATLPAAQFGTNYASTRVEPSFGNLQANGPSGGNIPITWLGGPCVTLQTRSSLTSGSWTDLPATDAKGSTNWPNTGGSQMFRLQKRPLP